MTQYKITLKDGTQMTVEGKSYREAMEGTAVPLHDIRNCEEIIQNGIYAFVADSCNTGPPTLQVNAIEDDDGFRATMRGMNGN